MKQMTAVRMALCSLFTALIAIGAFLQIPLPNFDYFTLQFFFVLMAGMLLGARLGALSAALYVLIGLLGIPVFAAGGGISYVLRPSFGFLLGFIVTAFCSGWIMQHGQRKWKTCFLAVLVITISLMMQKRLFVAICIKPYRYPSIKYVKKPLHSAGYRLRKDTQHAETKKGQPR